MHCTTPHSCPVGSVFSVETCRNPGHPSQAMPVFQHSHRISSPSCPLAPMCSFFETPIPGALWGELSPSHCSLPHQHTKRCILGRPYRGLIHSLSLFDISKVWCTIPGVSLTNWVPGIWSYSFLVSLPKPFIQSCTYFLINSFLMKSYLRDYVWGF